MKRFAVGLAVGVSLTTLAALAASNVFSDVKPGEWYFDSVNSLAEKGILKGYDDGKFRPGNYINRAELAMVIDNLLNIWKGKIKKLITSGYPVILPVAGQLLGNPNFTGAGPPYHMIVVKGFDNKNFITHDPGTKNGANYKYSFATIEKAIHDWNGSKDNVLSGRKAMLILTK